MTSLDRFVGGRFTLDRIIEATASTPAALTEIAQERIKRMQADREAELKRTAGTHLEKTTTCMGGVPPLAPTQLEPLATVARGLYGFEGSLYASKRPESASD